MNNDGKQLESLVAFVERSLVPPGFEVRSNTRVLNDEGACIAEFDIEIRGKVGSTSIVWLIECRDRPGQGAAPASWIEQLVGRKQRFRFNQVTAVSTTGFSQAALAFAREAGIETREVIDLEHANWDWLQISEYTQINRISDCKHVNLVFPTVLPKKILKAAKKTIESSSGRALRLVSSSTGEEGPVAQAFLSAVREAGTLFDNLRPGERKQVHLDCSYPTSDHFLLRTPAGMARIERLEFFGELRIEEVKVPVMRRLEYRHIPSGDGISQSIQFVPQDVGDLAIGIELHRMSESGATHVAVRRLPGADRD